MVVTVTDEEFVQMKMIVMDQDEKDALRMIKELVRRLEQQKNQGMKSHLD
jgi:hypothetical protein